jgi:hypothetical protein
MRYAIVSLFALALGGCDPAPLGACTHDVRPALVVEIEDAASGAYLAEGAEAVARDGAYADTLAEYAFSNDGTLSK